MKAIGGYFGLEINNGEHYHKDAIALNTGRNALEYILKAKRYSKIYIPYFTCDVLFEPIKKLQIEYSFYNINEQFEPVFDWSQLNDNEAFLYTNYFGLKNDYINSISHIKNLVIDNAQAFYALPVKNRPTFYSARKFFGIPDGAYLYIDTYINEVLNKDVSYQRFSHLLKRQDLSAEQGFNDFQSNDKMLDNQPILKMSKLTNQLMKGINYKQIASIRQANFDYLNQHLSTLNKISFVRGKHAVPMVYPFYSDNVALKNKLIDKKVYCATYWKSVLDFVEKSSLEATFVNQIIYLPIDQRYGIDELNYIIELIKSA